MIYMLILMILAVIYAPAAIGAPIANPTACDPKKSTAPVSAGGFCLTEEEYIELGQIRVEVAMLENTVKARDAEILAFEEWKAKRDDLMEQALSNLRATALDALYQLQEQHAEDLARARQRTLIERHGVVIGIGLGVITTVGATVAAVEVYQATTGPDRGR